MTTISVIVPVYNVEQYLECCVDSVLKQTFTDFELILVDDGSPDNCPAICDAYAARDSRIRVIHKENGGLSDARNAGLDAATGKYIYFLDGDDCIMEDLLEKTVARMDCGLDMVVFCFCKVYPDGRVIRERMIAPREYRLESPEERLEFICHEILTSRGGWEAWARVFRRDLIQQRRLRFADNRRIFAEDLYFTLCYCAHAVRVECIDNCLYKYRQRDDSIMGTLRNRHNIDRLTVLCQEVYRYLDQFDDCRILIQNIHTICCQIIAPHFTNYLWTTDKTLLDCRNQVISDITQWDFLESCIRRQLKKRRTLYAYYSGAEAAELMANLRFLLHGSDLRLRVQIRMIHMFRPLLDYLGKRWTK